MNHEYAPIDRHEIVFSALEETVLDLGYGMGSAKGHEDVYEVPDGCLRSDKAPMISHDHHPLSKEHSEQLRSHHAAPVTSPGEIQPETDS